MIYILLYSYYEDCYIVGAFSSMSLANIALKKMSKKERKDVEIIPIKLDENIRVLVNNLN